MIRRPPRSTLFPYTTLFRSALAEDLRAGRVTALAMIDVNPVYDAPAGLGFPEALSRVPFSVTTDRKSTRLNSSHLGISYAVFCLKKKKKKKKIILYNLTKSI